MTEDEERRLIDEAIAAGKVTRLPDGPEFGAETASRYKITYTKARQHKGARSTAQQTRIRNRPLVTEGDG